MDKTKPRLKVRNYSFRDSKRLPEQSMTDVNGVKIPSMPGSCYHAILCALAESKGQFCTWDKIVQESEKYMLPMSTLFSYPVFP